MTTESSDIAAKAAVPSPTAERTKKFPVDFVNGKFANFAYGAVRGQTNPVNYDVATQLSEKLPQPQYLGLWQDAIMREYYRKDEMPAVEPQYSQIARNQQDLSKMLGAVFLQRQKYLQGEDFQRFKDALESYEASTPEEKEQKRAEIVNLAVDALPDELLDAFMPVYKDMMQRAEAKVAALEQQEGESTADYEARQAATLAEAKAKGKNFENFQQLKDSIIPKAQRDTCYQIMFTAVSAVVGNQLDVRQWDALYNKQFMKTDIGDQCFAALGARFAQRAAQGLTPDVAVCELDPDDFEAMCTSAKANEQRIQEIIKANKALQQDGDAKRKIVKAATNDMKGLESFDAQLRKELWDLENSREKFNAEKFPNIAKLNDLFTEKGLDKKAVKALIKAEKLAAEAALAEPEIHLTDDELDEIKARAVQGRDQQMQFAAGGYTEIAATLDAEIKQLQEGKTPYTPENFPALANAGEHLKITKGDAAAIKHNNDQIIKALKAKIADLRGKIIKKEESIAEGSDNRSRFKGMFHSFDTSSVANKEKKIEILKQMLEEAIVHRNTAPEGSPIDMRQIMHDVRGRYSHSAGDLKDFMLCTSKTTSSETNKVLRECTSLSDSSKRAIATTEKEFAKAIKPKAEQEQTSKRTARAK